MKGLGRKITIRQLLTHTSGLPDRYTLHDVQGRPAGEVDHTNGEVLAIVDVLRDWGEVRRVDPGREVRLDEPRVLRVVIERGSKPLEDDVKTPVKIDVRSLGPQALPQLLSSHNFAWTLEQQH